MHVLVRTILALALTVSVLGAAGCSGAAAKLDGTGWRLTEWSVSSIDPSAVTITISFDDGQLGGTSAVNSYGAPYKAAAGGSLEIGEIVSTLMAGPEPAASAEAAYLELLRQVRRWAIDGDTLALSDDNGNPLLVFSPQ